MFWGNPVRWNFVSHATQRLVQKKVTTELLSCMLSDILQPTKKLKMSEHPSATLDSKTLNKFSRQNAALGAETTAKLIQMNVLIVGMRGVGIETAKNLMLQGVGAVTIVDPAPTRICDTGVNFFLNDADVGVPRAKAVLHRLHELNPLCKLKAADHLDEALIRAHKVLIITEPRPLPELVALNELCRSIHVAFYYAFVGGMAMSIFVDLGLKHVVFDPNGEKPVQKLITDISSLSNGETLITYEHPSGTVPELINGGFFEICDIRNGNAVNGSVVEVRRNDADRVKTVRVTWDSSAYQYNSGDGGMLIEKKQPTLYAMKSLAEKVKTPGSPWEEPPSLVMTDPFYGGNETQLHVSLVSVLTYMARTGSLPEPNNADHAAAVVAIAKELVASGFIDLPDFEINEGTVTKFSLHAGVEIQALSAFTGGVLAQEVVKLSGKFTPIPGFLHFSAFETLPTERPSAEDVQPRNHRNDELAAVFGWQFVEQLGNLNYFMVGCGALGCEFLKNFALNGVCCGPSGKLYVTDADRIEPSNLTRQFLFREHNVGQLKSLAAGVMARQMNPNLKVQHLELYVGPKTEDTFDDEFWLGLDGICNALDNMEARQYVDAQCVKYEKSLLESGTMGTGGNIDTIVPFKTRTYREGGQAVEGGGVPMCTLRNFPQITDHCIEWARDQFALLFTKLIKSTESFVSDPIAFRAEIDGMTDTAQAIFMSRTVLSFLRAVQSPSIGTCAQLSFDIFYFLFRDRILDLQNTFPADARIIKNGQDKGPYWSEKKRFPRTANFDPRDPNHTSFLLSCTCLFGVAIGLLAPKKEEDETWLHDYRRPEFIAEVASKLVAPQYIYCPIKTDDESATEDSSTSNSSSSSAATSDRETVINTLFDEMTSIVTTGLTVPELIVADFEKDDDANFHIDFITATANLRCDNYYIKRTDFQSCKVIAGKIIAAIATTTAAVCGLVILELFKLQLKKDTESYMNRQIGLSVNTFTSFTADEPRKFNTHVVNEIPEASTLPESAFDEKGILKEEFIVKVPKIAYPNGHSVWNKITCPASLTLKQFSDYLLEEHQLKMTNWDFVVGYKPTFDEDGKKVGTAGESSPVYPPKAVIDYSLLPSLELSTAEAIKAMMKARLPQEYQKIWRECKAAGGLPNQSADSTTKVITADTTIREILEQMEAIGLALESDKKIESRTVTGFHKRKFWVVPGNETPTCVDVASGNHVDVLCAIKFVL